MRDLRFPRNALSLVPSIMEKRSVPPPFENSSAAAFTLVKKVLEAGRKFTVVEPLIPQLRNSIFPGICCSSHRTARTGGASSPGSSSITPCVMLLPINTMFVCCAEATVAQPTIKIKMRKEKICFIRLKLKRNPELNHNLVRTEDSE